MARAFALLLGSALASLGCSPPGEDASVLLVVARGLRADRLGAYGYMRDTSPALDRLAREGTVFEAARTTDTARDRALERMLALGDGRTLAATLRDAGYATAAFSDEALPAGSAPEAFAGFDHVAVVELEDMTSNVLEWAQSAPRPFFVVALRGDVLPPYAPPRELRAEFAPPIQDEDVRATGASIEIQRHESGARRFGAADLRHLSNLYDAEVRALDERIAPWFGPLGGPFDGALIVLTADAGQALGERGRVGPIDGFGEELHRIPLVLRGPGVPRGRRDERGVSAGSLSATLAKLVGVDNADAGLLVPGVGGAGSVVETRWRAEGGADHDVGPALRARCDGRWKAVETPDGPWRLFDLHADSQVAVERPEVLARLIGQRTGSR